MDFRFEIWIIFGLCVCCKNTKKNNELHRGQISAMGQNSDEVLADWLIVSRYGLFFIKNYNLYLLKKIINYWLIF